MTPEQLRERGNWDFSKVSDLETARQVFFYEICRHVPHILDAVERIKGEQIRYSRASRGYHVSGKAHPEPKGWILTLSRPRQLDMLDRFEAPEEVEFFVPDVYPNARCSVLIHSNKPSFREMADAIPPVECMTAEQALLHLQYLRWNLDNRTNSTRDYYLQEWNRFVGFSVRPNQTKMRLRDWFNQWLSELIQRHSADKKSGKDERRVFDALLKALTAFRLLSVMSASEARKLVKAVAGYELYSNEAECYKAKARIVQYLFEHFQTLVCSKCNQGCLATFLPCQNCGHRLFDEYFRLDEALTPNMG